VAEQPSGSGRVLGLATGTNRHHLTMTDLYPNTKSG
jgi:hypothetical protein